MPLNSEITDYIDSKDTFAKDIMEHLRRVIHQASPNLKEAIKWKHPCFEEQGLVCAIAAFKKHVNLSFFKGKKINDSYDIFADSNNNEVASLTFTTIAEIPDDKILIDYIQQAIAINATEKKTPKKSVKKDKTDLIIPEDLKEQLSQNQEANNVFHQFSYSKQKDYIEWITSAKREATRKSRLATAIEWIAEGKSRHWKYENC